MSYSLVATAVLLLAYLLSTTTGQYQNEYEQELNVECASGSGLYRVRSEHSNPHQDRKWRWDCRQAATENAQTYCTWHTDINTYDGYMFFHCPANQFLAGVRSHHNDSREDRQWSAKCCIMAKKCSYSCRLSDFINGHDRYMDHSAEYKYVFTGLFSFHDNGSEDRRWKLMECKLETCEDNCAV